jgi:hypothetical protein
MARQLGPSGGRGGRARYGVITAGIMVVAAAAGALVAGLPEAVPDDVEPNEVRLSISTTTTIPGEPPTSERSISSGSAPIVVPTTTTA